MRARGSFGGFPGTDNGSILEVSCFRAALETAWPRDFLQAHTSLTRSTPLWASFQERYARKEVFGEAFRSARPAITVHIFKK